jgi:hypothetical protein
MERILRENPSPPQQETAMNREQVKGLARLNGYQVAGLAFAASAVAAIATLVILRRTILRRPEPAAPSLWEHPVDGPPPKHFSENLIIPGFTETGEQISRHDAEEGHSSEGV